MILAASCEFDRRHNSEVIERITDNEEVPAVRYIDYRFYNSKCRKRHMTSRLFMQKIKFLQKSISHSMINIYFEE